MSWLDRISTRIRAGILPATAIVALSGCDITVVGGGGDIPGTGGAGGASGHGCDNGNTGQGGAGGAGTTTGTGGTGGETSVAVTGICLVRDDHTNAPAFDDPDVGPGYVKKAIPGVNDIDGLRSACTNEIYQDLLAQHCATETTSVQAEWMTFNPDGSWNTTGCGDIGCEFMRCPQPITGICIVRDDHTDLPAFTDADVGPGYAKVAIPGVNDIAGLRSACTNEIYQDLLLKHCATETTEVQAELVTFNPDGTWNTTTCGDIGCDFMSCPVITGICMVRDDHTNAPAFLDPDVGPGYAKVAIPGVNDISGLRSACTAEIYQDLLAAHCATDTTPVQAEWMTFNPDGSWNTTGCGDIGCDFMSCP